MNKTSDMNNVSDVSVMNNMCGMVGMSGMSMYFHTGFREYILFEGVHTTTKGGFAAACLVVFAWSVLYEVLKFVREELQRRHRLRVALILLHGTQEEKAVVHSIVRQIVSIPHLTQTCLHAVQILMSYCLMLVFMTYNVYLAVCVVLGSALGYFATGWSRTQVEDENEHCP